MPAIMLVVQSCVFDVDRDRRTIPEPCEELEIAFSVNLPAGSSKVATRAMGDDDERKIDVLQVLVFESGADGKYLYTAYARKSGDTPSAPNEMKYIVKLRTGEYDLMLLANSDGDLEDSFPNTLQTGNPRAGVISGLQMEHSGMWQTDPQGTGHRLIPMWAMKKGVRIDKDTDLGGTNGFSLTRVIAKVNVKVELDEDREETFDLTSVRFYNRRTKAQLIPGQWNTMGTHVTEPSLVADDDGVEGPLTYGAAYINNEGNCVNEIYVLEAPKGAYDLHPEYPCIVIGGEYNGGEESFYRIDFATDNNGTVSYMPILRNYTYEITITGVGGKGFTDPDDAYRSRAVNIEAKVVEWGEGLVGDIYFDGQNFLRVEKGRYYFRAGALETEGADNKLYIETDYIGGWTFKGIEYDVEPGEEWLEFMGDTEGDAGVNEQRWLMVKENTSEDVRYASVIIEAGRIKGTVRVTQYAHFELELNIRDGRNGNIMADDAVLVFESDIWTGQQTLGYTLECNYPGAEIEVFLTNPILGYDPIRSSGSLPAKEILTGRESYERSFTIQPFARPAKGVFPQEALEYMFIARYDGQTVTRRFRVLHKFFDLQASPLPAGCLQGRFYEFDIDYNTDWEIQVDGTSGVLDVEVTNGVYQPNAESGVSGSKARKFRVKVRINKDDDGKTATIRFVKPGTSEAYAEVPVTSYYCHSNSYMVQNDQTAVIPVKKAFRIQEAHLGRILPATGNYRAQYIWTDFNPDNLTVSYSRNEENELLSEINVQIHNGNYGNAVVGLFLDEEIVWSWHVWFYDGYWAHLRPEGIEYTSNSSPKFTIMDRNLGAKSNEIASADGTPITYGHGLFYQWGRKDPFPGPAYPGSGGGALGEGGNTTVYAYNNADRFKPQRAYIGTTTGALKESIQRPNHFFRGTSDPFDWYLENDDPNTANPELWRPKDGLKSEFDPCPDGWRIVNYNFFNNYHYYSLDYSPKGTWRNFGWEDTFIGRLVCAGYINHDGVYGGVGTQAWTWYGCVDPTPDRNFSLGDRTYQYNDGRVVIVRERVGTDRSTALPVRCERDDERYWPSW